MKDKHAITALSVLLGYPLMVSPCPCDRLSLITMSSGLSHDQWVKLLCTPVQDSRILG